jgi:hypothetical protein
MDMAADWLTTENTDFTEILKRFLCVLRGETIRKVS